MRGKKLLVLILTLVFCFSMSGFFGNKTEKNIKKGDAAAESGNYKQAFEYYKKAGEDGKAPAKKLHMKIAEEKLADGRYDLAMEYMSSTASEYITEAEAAKIIVDYAEKDIEAMRSDTEEKFEKAKASNSSFRSGYFLDLSHIEDAILNDVKEGTPGREELLNDLYYLQGSIVLYEDAPKFDNLDWAYAMEYWTKCTAGTGYDIAQAAQMLKTGQFRAGTDILLEKIPSVSAVKGLYTEMTKKDPYQEEAFENLTQVFEYSSVLRSLNQEADENSALTEAFAETENLRIGFDRIREYTALTEEMVAELKETCAADPDGKVLILHLRGSRTPDVDICSDLMELLPTEYYPDEAAGVQYVITLHSTFETTGKTYTSGSKQIVESTAVTVYNAVTGKKLYTATQKGPTSLTMSYTGKAPTYYSAGAPEVSDLVKTAAEKITKDMGK